jgi:hypothetical protein
MALNLLIDAANKQAVRSLYSDRMLDLPEFAAGEARSIACCPVKRIRSQYDSKLFSPIDPTAWVIQVALGGGFKLPVAGNWPISYGANSSDAIISNDPTEDEISSVLNALASIIAAGGVTVQGASGFFVFTFNNVGARTMISGDPSLLVPLSLLTFEQIVAGDVDTQEVQILRIVQNAGTFATLATNTSAATVAFSLIQAGSGTTNAKWRVTLSPDRYAGYWTFTKPAGATSGPIGFDDNEAQVKTVFEGIYGTGNVLVLQETEDTFTVEHIGTNAHTAMTIVSTVDATALKTILFKSGVLDLRAPGVFMLFAPQNGEAPAEQIMARFEVEAADTTGYPEKILIRDAELVRPVLEPGMIVPQPTTPGIDYRSDIDAYTGSATSLESINGALYQNKDLIIVTINGSGSAWRVIKPSSHATDTDAGYVALLDGTAHLARVWGF